MKQGLIRYLETKLHNRYQTMHSSGCLDIEQVNRLKSKINTLKETILEGIKIRARVKEQVEGEKASVSLLGKQCNSKFKPIFSQIKTERSTTSFASNEILTTPNDISTYISEYYQNIYQQSVVEEVKQEWLLNFVKKTIDDFDNENLTSYINEEEILNVIKSFSLNKSPGIDGLPIEFYLKFFNIIKQELGQIINNCFMGQGLKLSQTKALIILIYKGGDVDLISNWRPISLICIDTKIAAKIIAYRIKPILFKCISKEQYCSGEQSIIDCNNTTRDIIDYISNENQTAALINVDLQKAFDSVDYNFLYKILEKMGFSKTFISWIKILYRGISSTCLINGHQGKPFPVNRGVRQGCPLSMVLYVLSQEPLYLAIKYTKQITPIELPCSEKKILGFADDTTILVKNDQSISHLFKIFEIFEKASGIKINISKTKILGFGEWKDRKTWPIQNIATVTDRISILGITYTFNLKKSIEISWSEILAKIKRKIVILNSRSFTLHQRAVVLNTAVLSKLWYTAHTYPLPANYSKLINKELFSFLWQGKYNPIKREVVHQSKNNGG